MLKNALKPTDGTNPFLLPTDRSPTSFQGMFHDQHNFINTNTLRYASSKSVHSHPIASTRTISPSGTDLAAVDSSLLHSVSTVSDIRQTKSPWHQRNLVHGLPAE